MREPHLVRVHPSIRDQDDDLWDLRAIVLELLPGVSEGGRDIGSAVDADLGLVKWRAVGARLGKARAWGDSKQIHGREISVIAA